MKSDVDLSQIENLVIKVSEDPFDPSVNFALALEYEHLNQTASAVSFYLRAAEYGFDTHPLIVYASLLRVSVCIEDQKDRNWTVSNAILQAIGYLPARPEAHFLMSRFHEKSGNWQESYASARLGRVFTKHNLQELPADVGYRGEYSLIFQQAVAAWWIGRRDESADLMRWLIAQNDLPDYYREAVIRNMKMVGLDNG